MSYETYKSIKDQHQDKIVFILRGDFYETFEEDAKTVARTLDLVLTSRPVGNGLSGERVALAGIPSYSFQGYGYADQLIEAGHRYVTAEEIKTVSVNKMSILTFDFPEGFWESEYQPDPNSGYNFDPESVWPEEMEVIDDGVLFHTPFGWNEA